MKVKSLALILLVFILSVSFLTAQERGLQIRVSALDSRAQVGSQWLVLIAINRYEQWPNLQQPVRDAKELRSILTARYYVDEVIELYDSKANKGNIIKLFVDLQKKLEPADSVLIYYAGHGHLDENSNSGFWIPSDAGLDKYVQENWIPNSQIRGLIENIKAKHFLLLSDSCFSGDILDVSRSKPDEIDNEYFKKAYTRRSRQVLTSGGSETVPDKSEFSSLLKRALEENTYEYIDPLMLYNNIRLGMTKTTPLMGNLKSTGHQTGASFLLFLRDGNVSKQSGSYSSAPSSSESSARSSTPTPQEPVLPVKIGDMVLVEGGEYQMGGGDKAAVLHRVQVRPFYISKYELTFDEYDEYCRDTGTPLARDEGWGRGSQPIINVSWEDAVEYCNWRSRREGLTPVYSGRKPNINCNFEANGYRLPTEAEWELAARGGSGPHMSYAGSDSPDNVAWYYNNSSRRSHPVGQKKANQLGIYDMSGNVWEWCWDWYQGDYYENSPVVDPCGPVKGNRKVRRGGSWKSGEAFIHNKSRFAAGPTTKSYEIGFRLVRSAY